MSEENQFQQKLEEMRQKYSDIKYDFKQDDYLEQDFKKTYAVKKKIADLELQRCQLMRENANLDAVDAKILKQKERFLILKKLFER